jgi:hypothetical protein
MKKKDRTMTLPTVKNKKLIQEKEFIKNAKKVKESLEEEINYLREKKQKNGDNNSSHSYFIA